MTQETNVNSNRVAILVAMGNLQGSIKSFCSDVERCCEQIEQLNVDDVRLNQLRTVSNGLTERAEPIITLLNDVVSECMKPFPGKYDTPEVSRTGTLVLHGNDGPHRPYKVRTTEET